MKLISYNANPTAQKFHASEKFVRGFMGPVGNGKTVCCITDICRMATLQAANDEGYRKTLWVLVRNTSLELLTTTVKTFKKWVPDEVCPLKYNPMITGVMRFPLGDMTGENSLLGLFATGIGSSPAANTQTSWPVSGSDSM